MDELLAYAKAEKERLDKLCIANPPKINTHGWWWKRFTPSGRKTQKIMQEIITDDWQNGGYERFMDEFTNQIHKMLEK